MAAKKPKSYVVTTKVPATFESDDGKLVVFDAGAKVDDDQPCVARALEIYPDHFTAA